MNNVTQILSQIEQGDPSAAEQLLPLVYDELRKLAAAKLAHEKPGQTLQATALVHEAFLRLVDQRESKHWNGRGHFFAAAAEAMRRILIESARRKASRNRGGQHQAVEVEIADFSTSLSAEQLIDLDEALCELERRDPEKAKLITLRYFGGMTLEQVANAMSISRATASRHWSFSRAWLYSRLNGIS